MSKSVATKPCPFCGGKAEIQRERNCDTLYVDHKKGCFLGEPSRTQAFHWGEPDRIPRVAFADWERRAKHKPTRAAKELL